MAFRCARPDHYHKTRYDNNGINSATYAEQAKVQDTIANCYRYFKNLLDIEPAVPELHRLKHATFLYKGLTNLPPSYVCLDASRPWLCYWILHSLSLLEVPIPEDIASHVSNFLARCQRPKGGFGGGPGQDAHLAPTYAAVSALCILGTEEAYKVINRETLQSFLESLRDDSGGFYMHKGGEIDIRGAYCAVSVAKLTNIVTPKMFDGTAEWIVCCQTYEGGFAGCPGVEAHGGYSFCGLAALMLLGKECLCDTKSLLRWVASKQMSFEGGFQGRTNKLVDGCYSFWQGGVFPLIQLVFSKQGDNAVSAERWMFDQEALQEYLLICCQSPTGGLIDKPGKPRDYYHSCYCLSGLSVAQHFGEGKLSKTYNIGTPSSEVIITHPIFNLSMEVVANSHQYFGKLSAPGKLQDA
ncbi:Protein farnesyltransferase subunit beta [Lamellibrachia satsuma]|nr:Protein farnesyltransferase subunit beta [Lamellibrachia satsuma]